MGESFKDLMPLANIDKSRDYFVLINMLLFPKLTLKSANQIVTSDFLQCV